VGFTGTIGRIVAATAVEFEEVGAAEQHVVAGAGEYVLDAKQDIEFAAAAGRCRSAGEIERRVDVAASEVGNIEVVPAVDRIVAGTAGKRVAAVATLQKILIFIAPKTVDAVSAAQRIVAGAAVDPVVAVAAEQSVAPGQARQGIVARTDTVV